MPNDFFTLDFLATFAGAVAAVTLIVQFTKGIVKNRFGDAAVRLYALIWSWIVLGFVLYVQGDFTAQAVGLAFLNGVLVAFTATGAYETIADVRAEKKKPDYSAGIYPGKVEGPPPFQHTYRGNGDR